MSWFGEAVQAVSAVGSVLSGFGTAKEALKPAPKPQPIPKPKEAAVMPMADPMAGRYAAQRRIAARSGTRSDSFLVDKSGKSGNKLG